MQTRYSNINDLFSGTGCYPLENLSKDNRWVKLADSLDWDYIEVEYNKRLKNQKVGAGNKPARMVVGAQSSSTCLEAVTKERFSAYRKIPTCSILSD